MNFIECIKNRAKQEIKTIVLPEAEDLRTLKATQIALKEKYANIVLVGNEEIIKQKHRQKHCHKCQQRISDVGAQQGNHRNHSQQGNKSRRRQQNAGKENVTNFLFQFFVVVRRVYNNHCAGQQKAKINNQLHILHYSFYIRNHAVAFYRKHTGQIRQCQKGKYDFGD